MGIAAMFCWLFAATFGAALLACWLIEHDSTHAGALRKVPGPAVLAHMGCALAGFVLWLAFLLAGWSWSGWGTLGALGGAAGLGSFMFSRWLPAHRTWAMEGTPPGYGLPGERSFPLTIVAAHGLFAVATVALVLVTLV